MANFTVPSRSSHFQANDELFRFFIFMKNRNNVMEWDSIQPDAASAWGFKAACGKLDFNQFWTNFKDEISPIIPIIQ